MFELEGIPDYLKIPQAERRAAWKGVKLTKQGTLFRPVSKVEEAATRKLRKELEQAEADKKAERFARLKELAAEKKAERALTGIPRRTRRKARPRVNPRPANRHLARTARREPGDCQ